MGGRHFAARAGVPAAGGGMALLLAVGVVLAVGFCAEAWSRQGARPLDYHATVVNGRIVGSAFLIEEGLAVTNGHVVRGLPEGGAVTLLASGDSRERVSGRLIAVSPTMDLAVVSVPDRFMPLSPRGDAVPAKGQAVISAGVDAAGGWPAPRLELRGTVVNPSTVQAAFGPGLVARLPGARPGFSGGPLFDVRGRLLGMVTAIRHGDGAARPASGFAPRQGIADGATEAYVLRADAIRAEARRLLRAAGR